MNAAAPLLSVEQLTTTVRIGERRVPVVDGVSFELRAGAIFGLVGESGSGKSLTALSIMGLLDDRAARIQSGRVQFHGRRMAMIFQDPGPALNPLLTIGEQIAEPLWVHRICNRTQAKRRAVELLAEVGIPEPGARARFYPHQLSGGQKQRAMIAMALACEPALLIADEPTTALDAAVQAQILELLGTLCRERKLALLLISHDLGAIAQLCTQVAVMYAGKIVEQGSVQELLRAPRHPYTHGLLRAQQSLLESSGVSGSKERPRLYEIPGSVPRAGTIFPGCAFAERCARADAVCNENIPNLQPVPGLDNAGFRCHHPL